MSTPRIRLLVTAGPTCEDIDEVRFLTNRSSGRMGIRIADAAKGRGWDVRLILGPVAVPPPSDVEVISIRSAEEMHQAVMATFPWCEALVMAAAVADYTPAEPMRGKMKKQAGELLLRLRRTRDILADLAVHPARKEKIVVGFSLDADLNLEEATRKLVAKNLDLIVANTTASFGQETIDATILSREGRRIALGPLPKEELAQRLLEEIEVRYAQREGGRFPDGF